MLSNSFQILKCAFSSAHPVYGRQRGVGNESRAGNWDTGLVSVPSLPLRLCVRDTSCSGLSTAVCKVRWQITPKSLSARILRYLRIPEELFSTAHTLAGEETMASEPAPAACSPFSHWACRDFVIFVSAPSVFSSTAWELEWYLSSKSAERMKSTEQPLTHNGEGIQ